MKIINADVRWTSACRQLDGGNTIIFAKGENANKSGRYGLTGIAHLKVCVSFLEKQAARFEDHKCRCPVDIGLPPA